VNLDGKIVLTSMTFIVEEKEEKEDIQIKIKKIKITKEIL
jgi:hypothetical protein